MRRGTSILLLTGVMMMVVVHVDLGHLVLGAMAGAAVLLALFLAMLGALVVLFALRVSTALGFRGLRLSARALPASLLFFRFSGLVSCHLDNPSPRGCRPEGQRRDAGGLSPRDQ